MAEKPDSVKTMSQIVRETIAIQRVEAQKKADEIVQKEIVPLLEKAMRDAAEAAVRSNDSDILIGYSLVEEKKIEIWYCIGNSPTEVCDTGRIKLEADCLLRAEIKLAISKEMKNRDFNVAPFIPKCAYKCKTITGAFLYSIDWEKFLSGNS